MSDGITVSGGGSIAVDTAPMQHAAVLLERARHELLGLQARIAECLRAPGLAPVLASALDAALTACRAAGTEAGDAAAGLRTAALRYGAVEQDVGTAVRVAAADGAATAGAALRLTATLLGPVAALAAVGLAGAAALDVLVLAAAREALTTGRIDPQVDPGVLGLLRLALSSSDDLVRGFLFTERPVDVAVDDPASRFGTGWIAAAAAGLLPAPAGSLVLTSRLVPGPGPRSLADLAARVPESKDGRPQIRIESASGADGVRRWIVYLTGTVTFAPDPGAEPFDLRSDVLGVAGAPTDSEAAVLRAMAAAGIRSGDPVLLVGHSQGALDATRIAERGGYAVAGIVTLGGPTGQIPPPAPVLAVEHDEDLVPILGGLAAGAGRLVVRRRLYPAAPPGSLVPFSAGMAPHALGTYARTLALAEASPDPRIRAFERRIAPFLAGRPGRAVLVRAERVRSPRDRRAAAAPDR